MPRYDAVIFDLFGTLVHTVPPDAYAAMLGELSELLGVSHADFTRRWRVTLEERETGALGDIAGVLRTTAGAVGGAPTSDQVAGAAERWMATASGWLVARDNAREVLGKVREDVIPQVADMALQAEGAEWAVAAGIVGRDLVFSVRNLGYVRAAGDVVRAVVEGLGVGGGHRSMAKGIIPLKAFRQVYGSTSRERIREALFDAFVKAIRRDQS